MNHKLDPFFYPKSIAIVGASNNIDKIGGFLFSQIRDKKPLKAYPINLREEVVQGVKAYPRLTSVGKQIDLVVIAIPGKFVIQTLEDCVMAGCKNIIIISAGFKETGEEGRKKEEEIKELVAKHGLNIVGPNCLGILNPELQLNCSFAKDIPRYGKTALISQSGAVIDAIIDWSFKHKIGFSKIVSMGNMAGVNELTMLEYLKDDPKTGSIVFYMETLEKGRLFADVLKEVAKVKPVIIIKPGSSDNAKKAIGSHTGSLAQDNVLVKSLIEDNNGILVEDLNELFNILIALQSNYNPQESLAIVTNAGGPGVIATDVLAKTGYKLYQFSEEQKALMNFLPAEASRNNPIDILGDGKSDRYKGTLEFLEHYPDLHNILVLLTPQIMTDCDDIAQAVIDVSRNSKKNIFSSFLGEKEISGAVRLFDMYNFANFQTPGEALNAMDKLRKYKLFDYHDKLPHYHFNKENINHIRKRIQGRKGMLDYTLTREILSCLGMRLPDKQVIKGTNEIPFVKLHKNKKYILKVDSKDVVHKKDVGGLAFGITIDNFKEEATKMFAKMKKITSDFTLTLEEKYSGVEVIVGLKSDPQLGHFLAFGMGGTNVSIFNDVHFATCPLSKKRAEELVQKSKVSTLLNGYRGSQPVDFKHLYEILVRMSFLQELFPEIKEVDLNPVICNEHGIYLVDVKLIVQS